MLAINQPATITGSSAIKIRNIDFKCEEEIDNSNPIAKTASRYLRV